MKKIIICIYISLIANANIIYAQTITYQKVTTDTMITTGWNSIYINSGKLFHVGHTNNSNLKNTNYQAFLTCVNSKDEVVFNKIYDCDTCQIDFTPNQIKQSKDGNLLISGMTSSYIF